MTINRLTLPANFHDSVSRRMLTAPIPEFFWNKYLNLASTQANIEAISAAQMGITPDRSPPEQGAPAAELAQLQLVLNDDSGQSGGILVSDDLSADGSGHTVRFQRPVFSGGSYTVAARRTPSGFQISTTPIDLTTESTSLTLERLSGPYDTVNSRVAPYAIDRRDAKRSIISLTKLAAQALAYDRAKLVDSILNSACDTVVAATLTAARGGVGASYVNFVIPGEGRKTAKAEMTAPGSSPMDLETLLRAENVLDNRGAPRLANGKRMVVLRTEAAKQLLLDPDFREYAKLGQSEPQSKNPLFNSLAAVTPTMMIYRSSTLTQDTSTVSGNTINQGIMFGLEIFGYGVGEEVNVPASTSDNYGNQALFIWQSMEAFGIMNTDYGIGLLSD